MRISLLSIWVLLFTSGCFDDSPKHVQYKKGDFWVADFRTNSFPSKAYKDDRIYCSSLETGSNKPNYFYCLNLKTGKVEWATQVKNWASQPPIICDSFIYYCSYVGDIYKFDKNGNQIWLSEFNTTYGGHSLNPLNNNLILSTVAYGLREIDFKTGEIVDSIGHGKMDIPFPVFQNDTIYQVISDTLFCYTSKNNSELWKKKTGSYIDRLFLNNNLIYYFDDTQRLYCRDGRTGALVWQSDSIFPKQPINPRLEFEGDKILSYFFSNLNNILVINNRTGKVLKSVDYKSLQRENYLIPEKRKYSISFEGKEYEILVANTLFGPFDFRDQFDILIEKNNNR